MANAIKDAILDYKIELDQNVGNRILNPETDFITEDKPISKIYKNIVFKVQIAASSKNLETKSYNFKGLSAISKSKVGKLYKYYYGHTSDYNKIKESLKVAKQKGYTTSYIVAFKNNKPITLSKALKDASN